MTGRARAAMWLLTLACGGLWLTACSDSRSGPPHAAPAMSPASEPVTDLPPVADPAVGAAVRFELAHCSWDFEQPLSAYVAAQEALATSGYRREIQDSADRATWQAEVVASRQQVTCTVSAAQRLLGSPTTATHEFVRMSVHAHVTSLLGSFDAGAVIASWRVERVDQQWLVAGPFDGG